MGEEYRKDPIPFLKYNKTMNKKNREKLLIIRKFNQTALELELIAKEKETVSMA